MLPFPTRMIAVTTTYLHIPVREQFRPAFVAHPDLRVHTMRAPSVALYRFLYAAIGRDFVWIDRLHWTDAQYQDYLSRPTTTIRVLFLRGTPIGYIDLDASATEAATEIVYFGLVPAVHGRGFGKHLLSVGVQRAFDDGAKRVWLHTCTLDGPHALANYLARGFIPYKTTTQDEPVPVDWQPSVPMPR
ncbi:MAG: GNAT family N-acetyltransferase, partial [Chloroflexota bacterium]|nr:GNAT family N-acetyltransferase [Chloroflexota bacterium]